MGYTQAIPHSANHKNFEHITNYHNFDRRMQLNGIQFY